MTALDLDEMATERYRIDAERFPGGDSWVIVQLLDALTDARRELAEQKRINTSNLRVMTEQLELARQKIADAPHESWCASNDWGNDLHPDDAPDCDCWKSEAAE